MTTRWYVADAFKKVVEIVSALLLKIVNNRTILEKIVAGPLLKKKTELYPVWTQISLTSQPPATYENIPPKNTKKRINFYCVCI